MCVFYVNMSQNMRSFESPNYHTVLVNDFVSFEKYYFSLFFWTPLAFPNYIICQMKTYIAYRYYTSVH